MLVFSLPLSDVNQCNNESAQVADWHARQLLQIKNPHSNREAANNPVLIAAIATQVQLALANEMPGTLTAGPGSSNTTFPPPRMSNSKPLTPEEIRFLKTELTQYLFKHGRPPSPTLIRQWSQELNAPQFSVTKWVHQQSRSKPATTGLQLQEEQLSILEEYLCDNAWPDQMDREHLAEEASLTPTQVEQWFIEARKKRQLQARE
ncbi:hypothetical protein SeLEV6574_g03879 [Synchytrium endobioticum]|uniref:Homeobox domain-containing protein n=1 Tax=Synchytrium endobioticum TaxID=286115 RepID=A0A507D2A0_9FUNG|nr:hypothetical protein SeLEV6574_g03879 [Synchytrium endobioticum]